MFDEDQHRILEKFQSRTSIANHDRSMRILKHFNWDCLEAVNFVLSNIQIEKPLTVPINPSFKQQNSSFINEIQHFSETLRKTHGDIEHWPCWSESSFDNAILRSTGPFLLFLSHDGSKFKEKFLRQILCSSSILSLFTKYKCTLWPLDITQSTSKLKLIETKSKIQSILIDCFSCITNVHEYPLLIVFRCQKQKIILNDIAHGHWDYDQVRSCLERALNPCSDEFFLSNAQMTSICNGWIGGRTVGHLRRQPNFVSNFQMSRKFRATLLPNYISFYKPKDNSPEIILTFQQVQRFLNRKANSRSDTTSPKSRHSTPNDTINVDQVSTITEQNLLRAISKRRAGWCLRENR